MVEALIQIFSSMMMERYGMWVQRHLPNPTFREKAVGGEMDETPRTVLEIDSSRKKENQQKTTKKQGQATSTV